MSVKLAARPARTRLIIMAAVLALAGLLATAGQAGSARAATARTEHAAAVTGTGSAKPTIVLVHGAWADAGSWNAVIGLLQRAGYTVYAPPNPLEGLAIDTATLADFLQHTITGPIVLVGHSYGGEVITNAATGNSQVKALVYVDGYLPEQGGHLVILHHTDCGITRLAHYPEQLAAFFEIPAGELDSKAVADPYAAVRIDTAIARRMLPSGRLVSGLVYDVATGLIQVVDPPTGQ